jgi:putative protein-disulfide isomerase
MAQNNNRLIYFADPMCSWCYGFSPELTQVLDQLDDSTGFSIVLGGLRPYGTETMAQLGDFLQEHWQEVNERSEQIFNYDILKEDAFVYDTEPACRAVVLMRQLQPDRAFDFFKAVQKAFYQENKNTNRTETYVELAKDFGIEPNTFRTAFESEDIKTLVKKDFTQSAQLGIRGFPTLVLQQGENYYLISNGYMTAEQVADRIKRTRSNIVSQ